MDNLDFSHDAFLTFDALDSNQGMVGIPTPAEESRNCREHHLRHWPVQSTTVEEAPTLNVTPAALVVSRKALSARQDDKPKPFEAKKLIEEGFGKDKRRPGFQRNSIVKHAERVQPKILGVLLGDANGWLSYL
ncbi:hypothetical protein W97_06816 [Coniosporium apollinis CBS 100218]|uniref:Uncharacterized protein n=1 Tax=Coniosporium apollinis (strain CBS 100218) TaxID=1168221 RepID=R7Z0S2_CONA1|nr:uncharacterized protein W97_06816 [Coniosporium apollinis CBS 100218]EON67673.1 hypothetical protein W97_06816 [Coniosporium apollinis CBS 100218]